MKTISLSVVAEVTGEELSSVESIRGKAEKMTYEADTEAKAAKAREVAQEFSVAATAAEGKALEDVRERAAALVESLQEAGVRVTTASLLFGPRPGSHEQSESVDLLAKPEAESRDGGEGGEGSEGQATETGAGS